MTVLMELGFGQGLEQAEFFPGYERLLRGSGRAGQIVLFVLDKVGQCLQPGKHILDSSVCHGPIFVVFF